MTDLSKCPEPKRWATLAELRKVVQYEWRSRRAWKSRLAPWRALWWWLVRNYACELCQRCGRPVGLSIGDTFWRATDDLWGRVAGWPGWRDEMGELAYLGPPGTLCPACFTAQADEKGIRLYWKAVVQ